MERLTHKNEFGIDINKNKDCPTRSICWNCDNRVKDCEYFNDAIEKLAKYEDLEEQGLLLKLPCPIGTEVYKVREVCYCDFNYDDEVCTRYCKYKCEEGLYCEHQIVKYEISKVLFTIDMCDEFNKTIFLTKEEVTEEIIKRTKKNK